MFLLKYRKQQVWECVCSNWNERYVTCNLQGGVLRDEVWREGSEASVKGEGLVGAIDADTRFGVFSDAFLEEVCFALKADCLHPFEQVPGFEVTVAAKA